MGRRIGCYHSTARAQTAVKEGDPPMTKSKHVYVSYSMPLIERLEFHSMPEPNSGCQLWLGSGIAFGHGRMRWDGRLQLAHRLAWKAHRGPIPDGLMVCHRCDVPSCINPAHLFLGDNRANIQDMYDKGRRIMSRGANGPNARLTDDQVRAIRSDARPQRLIAADFGIHIQTVSNIKTRRYRSDVL
jgi:hypothetical protein